MRAQPYHRRPPPPSRSRRHELLSFSPLCFHSPSLLLPITFSLPLSFYRHGMVVPQDRHCVVTTLLPFDCVPPSSLDPSSRRCDLRPCCSRVFTLSHGSTSSPTVVVVVIPLLVVAAGPVSFPSPGRNASLLFPSLSLNFSLLVRDFESRLTPFSHPFLFYFLLFILLSVLFLFLGQMRVKIFGWDLFGAWPIFFYLMCCVWGLAHLLLCFFFLIQKTLYNIYWAQPIVSFISFSLFFV